MYEIEIEHNKTGERKFIFGYSITNAFARANLSFVEWSVLFCDYVD
jgi:hypothetical protein